jgi:hypothetical protein
MMSIRNTLVLASLALPLTAQDKSDAQVARTDAAATFYQAYFLDYDQARSAAATKRALVLYRSFLTANPRHELAGKAASRAVVLLYASGDLVGARAFAEKHGELIATVEAASRRARGNRAEADETLTAKLSQAMQTARDAGNDAEASRIGSALRRAGGRGGRGGRSARGGRGGFGSGQRGGRGGRGGQRGGRAGGRRGAGVATIPKIAAMRQADAKKAVDTLVTSMERMIDFMAQRGQSDQADKLEGKLDKIQDLVDDGKLGDAQKILDTLEADMGTAAGGRSRRRGGDSGGTGGRRRRRG